MTQNEVEGKFSLSTSLVCIQWILQSTQYQVGSDISATSLELCVLEHIFRARAYTKYALQDYVLCRIGFTCIFIQRPVKSALPSLPTLNHTDYRIPGLLQNTRWVHVMQCLWSVPSRQALLHHKLIYRKAYEKA